MNCNICSSKYNQNNVVPRILTGCGHTVCEGCALKLMNGSVIICPFDRVVTNVDSGVDQLTTNFSVLEVINNQGDSSNDSDSGSSSNTSSSSDDSSDPEDSSDNSSSSSASSNNSSDSSDSSDDEDEGKRDRKSSSNSSDTDSD